MKLRDLLAFAPTFTRAFAASAPTSTPWVAFALTVAGWLDCLRTAIEMQDRRRGISDSNTKPKFSQCRAATHRFFTGTRLFIHDVHSSPFEYFIHPMSYLHRRYLPPLPPLPHQGLPLLFPLHDGLTAAAHCDRDAGSSAQHTPLQRPALIALVQFVDLHAHLPSSFPQSYASRSPDLGQIHARLLH